MFTYFRYALTLTLITVGMLAAQATSLWTPQNPSVMVDRKAHTVGDILTIIVTQSSSATTQATHQTDKNMNVNTSAGTGLFRGFGGLGVTADRSTNGTGSSQSNSSFIDQLSVTVKEVLPNGNLRVEGTRKMRLEKDEVSVEFSGIVRPADIQTNNTISSILIADQQLTTSGTGPIAEKQRPGLISRLFSWLW